MFFGVSTSKHIFIDCLLQWDSKKKKAKQCGILGKVIAFAPAHEEQGRKKLQSHWQIWVEELSSDVIESLWNEDETIRAQSHDEFYSYVDDIMNATFSSKLNVNHACERMPATFSENPDTLTEPQKRSPDKVSTIQPTSIQFCHTLSSIF